MTHKTAALEEKDILYEIALAIGRSFDLDEMLDHSIKTIIRQLNCQSACVLSYQTAKLEKPTDTASTHDPVLTWNYVYSLPKNSINSAAHQKFIADLALPQRYSTLETWAHNLPKHRPIHPSSFYALNLPEFGLLVLQRHHGDLAHDLLLSLEVLMHKLAHSAVACMHEAELKRQIVAANAASIAKSTFLANMSHEIRTPMNAILGFAQVMQRDPDLTTPQHDHLRTILRAGEHLLALINDILEISKIEAGKVPITPSTFDLPALLDDLDMLFRTRIMAKPIRLSIKGFSVLPRYIHTDEGKLRQILLNLLGNAVKFTHAGHVTLRTKILKFGQGHALTIAVADTGPGIARSEQSRLFCAFEQTTSGLQNQGGTGLGLAISRQYARLLGGDIKVRSKLGQGSVFRLTLPISLTANTELVESAAEPRQIIGLAQHQAPPRILIADDENSNLLLLEELLIDVGFEVLTAHNGHEAVAQFTDYQPDLVLMDINMPIMDGKEATQAIKATPAGAKTPIIAVTASAFAENRRDFIAMGADDFLAKPFYPNDLYEKIGAHLHIGYTYNEAVAPTPTALAITALAPGIMQLPNPLVTAMREALYAGDFLALQALITEVHAHNPSLSAGLCELAEQYAYDSLQSLLNSA